LIESCQISDSSKKEDLERFYELNRPIDVPLREICSKLFQSRDGNLDSVYLLLTSNFLSSSPFFGFHTENGYFQINTPAQVRKILTQAATLEKFLALRSVALNGGVFQQQQQQYLVPKLSAPTEDLEPSEDASDSSSSSSTSQPEATELKQILSEFFKHLYRKNNTNQPRLPPVEEIRTRLLELVPDSDVQQNVDVIEELCLHSNGGNGGDDLPESLRHFVDEFPTLQEIFEDIAFQCLHPKVSRMFYLAISRDLQLSNSSTFFRSLLIALNVLPHQGDFIRTSFQRKWNEVPDPFDSLREHPVVLEEFLNPPQLNGDGSSSILSPLSSSTSSPPTVTKNQSASKTTMRTMKTKTTKKERGGNHGDHRHNEGFMKNGASLEGNNQQSSSSSSSSSPSSPVEPSPNPPVEIKRFPIGLAIDAEETVTVDDAVAITDEPNPRVLIFVADTSSNVRPRSFVDRLALIGESSQYFPLGRKKLLPELVDQKLTLKPGENQVLTISCRLLPTGAITEFDVFPSIVENITRITYIKSNEILESPEGGGEIASTVSSMIHRLWQIAQLRKRYRSGRAGINGQPTAPVIKVDPASHSVDLRGSTANRTKSEILIEELMLLAGESASQFCIRHQIPVWFRTQPEIPKPMLQAINCFHPGVRIHQKIRLAQRAEYETHPGKHFGTGIDTYSRVTSPLRRYPDMMNHHQIRGFFQGKIPFTVKDLEEMRARVNFRSSELRRAQQNSQVEYFYWYIWNGLRSGSVPRTRPALVVSVNLDGTGECMVECLPVGFPVTVRVPSLGLPLDFNPGDICDVTVISVQPQNVSIQLSISPPKTSLQKLQELSRKVDSEQQPQQQKPSPSNSGSSSHSV